MDVAFSLTLTCALWVKANNFVVGDETANKIKRISVIETRQRRDRGYPTTITN